MILGVAPSDNSNDSGKNAFKNLWELGYTRLVPVVPPDATLFEKSSLSARLRAGDDSRGKAPGIRRKDGTWQGMQFVKMESTEDDLDVWHAMGASAGIKTGDGLIAVDIDTTDKTAAQEIYQLAAQILGDAAVRFGRKPKCLLLYEAPKETTYMQVRFSTETEPEARVEILSEGRQFVADGVHPVTGKPYAWPRGVPRRDALSRITVDQLNRFLEAVAEAMPESAISSSGTQDAPGPEALKAPDWDALKATVEAMPNTTDMFPTREAYIRVAYAIKAAAPDGYEHEARELFLDWCDRWDSEADENDPDIALADWGRAKPPFKIGYEYLQSHAPKVFFEAHDLQHTDPSDMFAANQSNSRYNLLSIDDVLDLPPPKFMVDRHIPEKAFGILFGEPGSGKSFMALDLALHIAYGLPDWHGDPIQTPHDTQGVLYIAGEGASGFRDRIAAWKAKHLLPEGKTPDFSFVFQPVNFMRPEDIKQLTAAVRATGKNPALIVVDTVSRSIPGADENLQKDMTVFVAACDALKHTFGATVLGVHHTGKTGEMRGSSVFLGQADFVFRLKRSKTSKVGRLFCDKQKDAPDGWSDSYSFATVETAEGRDSLVPLRVENMTPEGNEITKDVAKEVLAAVQRDFEAGDPWSRNSQAKARYAPKRAYAEFGIRAEDAEQMFDLWERTGVIEWSATTDKSRNRIKGYTVVGPVEASVEASADAAEVSEEVDLGPASGTERPDEDGIFG